MRVYINFYLLFSIYFDLTFQAIKVIFEVLILYNKNLILEQCILCIKVKIFLIDSVYLHYLNSLLLILIYTI